MKADQIDFLCPVCSLWCRLSQKQRAVQHQAPSCAAFRNHKHTNTIQEFLRLAMMKAGGGLPLLGNAALLTSDAPEPVELRETRAKQTQEIIEQLNEGLKKL